MTVRRGRGLYETLISEQVERALRELGQQLDAKRATLRTAEAADRIALHLGRVIERAISSVGDDKRAEVGVAVARKLVDLLAQELEDSELADERPIVGDNVLHALVGKLPDGQFETIAEPLIPLLDTTLLTNAPGEPGVGSQVRAEIHSADRIDVIMAFIRRSGLAPLLEPLRAHCQAGRALRVLTTTYTGSTEGRALDELAKIGAQVRVSYDVTSTRLHAKACYKLFRAEPSNCPRHE